jgi:hypothetical protein
MSTVRLPAGATGVPVLQSVHRKSEAHPASYSVSARGSFSEIKEAIRKDDCSPPSMPRSTPHGMHQLLGLTHFSVKGTEIGT